MSRIGKQPVPLAKGVDVRLTEELVEIKGPKGMLQVKLLPGISVAVEDGKINISRSDDEPQSRSFHGLARALLANAATGVTEGWSKKLDIIGIGYRAESKGSSVLFNLGYSHQINYAIPQGIQIDVDAKANRLTAHRMAAHPRGTRRDERTRLRFFGSDGQDVLGDGCCQQEKRRLPDRKHHRTIGRRSDLQRSQ